MSIRHHTPGDFEPARPFDDANTHHTSNPESDSINDSSPRDLAPRRNTGAARLWPAAILITLSLGLLAFRLSIADWHWTWPWTTRTQPVPIVQQPEPAHTPANSAPAPAPAPLAANGTGAETTAAEPEPAPELAQSVDPDDTVAGTPLALNDIEREADRIRKEREELEKIKEQAGKEIANAPRRPLPGMRGIDPALIARQQAEMERFMMERMAEHQKRFEEMLRSQRNFMANRGLRPRLDGLAPDQADAIDQAFERMRQEMEAFEREALAMLREPPQPLRPGLIMPPAPGLDIPAPPLPGLIGDDDDNQPQVRRFSFVDPNGNRIQGFEFRMRSFGR